MISNNVHIFSYKIDENQRRKYYNDLVNYAKSFKYPVGHHNFCVDGKFIDELKNFFTKKCEMLYGEFKLLPDPRTSGFVYVTNKNHYFGENIHNHTDASSYVGVYYLNMPSVKNVSQGCLKFFDSNKKYLESYLPKNDDFVIFDSDLYHSIAYCNTEEYRVSINVEMKVEKKINFFNYTGD